MRWSVAPLVLAAACFNPKPAPGLECTVDGHCPTGQDCIDGICEGVPEPDATPSGTPDAPPGTPDAPRTPDAMSGSGDLCASARALPVVAGTYNGTFAGANDDYAPPPACTSDDGVEVIYRLDFTGTQFLSFSVDGLGVAGWVYAHTACPPPDYNTCGAINSGGAGVTFSNGPVYLVIERSAGSTGTAFQIDLMTN